MKVYDYTCPSCAKREERWVKRHDDTVKCACGSVMLKLPPATKTTWHFADKRA